MNVLFIVGSCLRINTSANLCHLAYIRGCIDCGYSVDVVAMSEKGCVIDESIHLPSKAKWFLYDQPLINSSPITTSATNNSNKPGAGRDPLTKLKNFCLNFYGVYGRTAHVWANRAKSFSSPKKYDRVISLATPYISHYLAAELIKNGHVICDQLIQIWEDPWESDLYHQQHNLKVFNEEKRLLSEADKIIYSSPITLAYQAKSFPEYSNKMSWHTLPFYYKSEPSNSLKCFSKSFGYFGDYYSMSRDIRPFYKAALSTNFTTRIFGNTDLNINSEKCVEVSPRVELSKLKKVEQKTSIYVFLSNLHGGQIPGKVYQYAVSSKPILFILDGTPEEQKVLEQYFSVFGRFTFCKNTKEDIEKAMLSMLAKPIDTLNNTCIVQFSPTRTIQDII